jgi:hypothetical protein
MWLLTVQSSSCNTVKFSRSPPTFQRNAPPPSWGSAEPSKKPAECSHSVCRLLFAGSLVDLLFNPEDGGSTFLWNVSGLLLNYIALRPKRLSSLAFRDFQFTRIKFFLAKYLIKSYCLTVSLITGWADLLHPEPQAGHPVCPTPQNSLLPLLRHYRSLRIWGETTQDPILQWTLQVTYDVSRQCNKEDSKSWKRSMTWQYFCGSLENSLNFESFCDFPTQHAC